MEKHTPSLTALTALLILLLPLLRAAAALPTLTPEGAFALSRDSKPSSSKISHDLAERERLFYKLTSFPSGGWPPVTVMVHLPAGEAGEPNLPSLRVDAGEGGIPRIQVDLVEESLGSRQVARLLATALLLREYYAGHAPEPGSPIMEFPPWVISGLGECCEPVQRPAVIPSRFLEGEAAPTITIFLAQKPPGNLSDALGEMYDSMAAKLLQAGLRNSGGKAFREWLGTFDPRAPAAALARPPWPPDWPMPGTERRWLLLMAGERDQADASMINGVKETLARYDAIVAEIPTAGHSLLLLRKEKSCAFTAQQLSERLVALRLQANPMATALLDDTIALLDHLRSLPEKKVVAQVTKITALRSQLLERSSAVEAYLDWYEASRLPVRSGIFDRLLGSPESRLKRGPVGRHLDAIEARGW